jgi:hypothetical protein
VSRRMTSCTWRSRSLGRIMQTRFVPKQRISRVSLRELRRAPPVHKREHVLTYAYHGLRVVPARSTHKGTER